MNTNGKTRNVEGTIWIHEKAEEILARTDCNTADTDDIPDNIHGNDWSVHISVDINI